MAMQSPPFSSCTISPHIYKSLNGCIGYACDGQVEAPVEEGGWTARVHTHLHRDHCDCIFSVHWLF